MKEVFIFGAGASVASAGISFPSGKELVWTYFQDCRDFSEVDGNRQVTSEDKRKTREQFADLLKLLERPDLKDFSDQFKQMIDGAPTHNFNVPKGHYIDEFMDNPVQ